MSPLCCCCLREYGRAPVGPKPRFLDHLHVHKYLFERVFLPPHTFFADFTAIIALMGGTKINFRTCNAAAGTTHVPTQGLRSCSGPEGTTLSQTGTILSQTGKVLSQGGQSSPQRGTTPSASLPRHRAPLCYAPPRSHNAPGPRRGASGARAPSLIQMSHRGVRRGPCREL